MDDLNSSRARRSTPPVTQQHGAAGSLGRFWQGSYAADYLGLATLLVVYILVRPSRMRFPGLQLTR